MIRLVLTMLGGAFGGALRRIFRGPTQPSRSFQFDVMISGQRKLLGYMSSLRGSALRKVSAGGLSPSKPVLALGLERVESTD
jgi:hypothetical protein